MSPNVQPEIVQRTAQPYVGISGVVAMCTIGEVADRIPELLDWLAARGVPPAGAPFLRYTVITMANEVHMEAGVPVAAPLVGDRIVAPGVLPAGRYATVLHHGEPDGLIDATTALLHWARKEALSWDMTLDGDIERWACRYESYLTNPEDKPDPRDWETELAFRLAD